MLANPALFDINGHTPAEREDQAWQAAKAVDKTDFALKYAIEETKWATPRYIEEGLRWLAEPPMAMASPEEVPLEDAPADEPLNTRGNGND